MKEIRIELPLWFCKGKFENGYGTATKFLIRVTNETEKAYCCDYISDGINEYSENNKDTWLPKSQIKIIEVINEEVGK